MKMKHVKWLVALLVAPMLCSCSDSDDDYQAQCPVFTDITFEPATLQMGTQVKATAVRRNRGKYVVNATYKWSVDDVADSLLTTNYSVSPDPTTESADPSVTFTLPNYPGRCNLTLTVRYTVVSKSSPKQTSYTSRDGSMTANDFVSSTFATTTINKQFTISR